MVADRVQQQQSREQSTNIPHGEISQNRLLKIKVAPPPKFAKNTEKIPSQLQGHALYDGRYTIATTAIAGAEQQ